MPNPPKSRTGRRTASSRSRRQSAPQSRRHRQRSYGSAAAAGAKLEARRRRTVRGSAPPLRNRLRGARIPAALVAAGLIALLALLFVDDRFYVHAAEVNGEHYTDSGEVYRLAGVEGYSVFWINPQKSARQIEALPFVRSASVRPILPDKVRIDLTEREPVAVVRFADRVYWADEEGVLLPPVGQLEHVPILEDLEGSSVDESGRIDGQLVASVQELDRFLPDISRFSFDQVRGLHFYLADGTLVIMGSEQGLARRVQELFAVQTALANQGQLVSEIDLSRDGGYYYRLAP